MDLDWYPVILVAAGTSLNLWLKRAKALVSREQSLSESQAFHRSSGLFCLETFGLAAVLHGALYANSAAHRLPSMPLLTLIWLPLLWFLAGRVGSGWGYRADSSWALGEAMAVRALSVLLRPLSWLAYVLVRAFRGTVHTRWHADDLMGDEAEESERLMSALSEFKETIIREEMVPRTDMVALPLTATPDEIRNTIITAGHSRIPIYDGTVDTICGILHVKDLFRAATGPSHALPEDEASLRAMLRSTFFVPEIMKIEELVREFQRKKTHLAIVVDEYGGTAGLITLEDCIEQIVGEIQDEYDVEDKYYRVLPDQRVMADGRVSIYDLGDVIGAEFPEDEDYETLAGFVTVRTGVVPKVGDTIEWGGFRFSVRDADERRVTMVEIERVA